jgi:competence protein ComEA
MRHPNHLNRLVLSVLIGVYLRLSASLILLIALVLAIPLSAQTNDLPPGPQREILTKLCVGCHEMDLVVARRHTRAEWDGVIEDMQARGTQGTPKDLSGVAEYLSKYLGKVSVNTASAQELQESLKISEKDAQAIVAWRDQHGSFKNFEEVRKVPGLDAAKMADKRGWMAFD